MCGIIGCVGYDDAKNVLIKGLKALEYRGYDSAGIAVLNNNKCKVTKCKGRVNALEEKVKSITGSVGIGHTRWATHGKVSDSNSHPHKYGKVTLVHNGIIENYEALRDSLGVENELKSETDSEIIAVLIDRQYKKYKNCEKAIIESVKMLQGTFALAIIFDGEGDKIYATRNVSPIVCCKSEKGSLIASDIIAIGQYSKNYFVLPEMTIAKITRDDIEIKDFAGNSVCPETLKLDWDINAGTKGGFPFYMEKEICEQPDVLRKTINSRIKNSLPDLSGDKISDELFENCTDITVIACGTAMHAGLIGKHLIENICEIPVNVYMASEFIYSNPIINKSTLVICVSQSGETIDTLEALKYAQKKGAKSLAIVNVKGSSIAMQSDYVIYTQAGPEIAVASTKAYTTQVAIFYLLTARMAYTKKKLNYEGVTKFIDELAKLPDAVENIIARKDEIHLLAKKLLASGHTFMIGRGFDYPSLLEASLKLKEISYIHSEAFASGELKHGTIALISKGTPVIALMTQRYLAAKQISNIKEVMSRKAEVITFAKKSLVTKDISCDFVLPEIDDDFTAVPSVVALQLLAYYVSSDKGLDVDKPRNLAKVVTVE